MTAEFAPYTLHAPVAPAVPLVCDSPHSGTHYPADFRHAVPLALLRQGEDTHVEALWADVPAVGGTLLAAQFPRTYIDPNRELDDLDAALLDEPWHQALAPTAKTQLGHGLLWRMLGADEPIYDRVLSAAEVRNRIDNYYRPYHAALAHAVDACATAWQGVWHLNLHSMPDDAYRRLGLPEERPLADFVLGDRDGTTCEPAFVDLVEDELRARGYTVARNDPYKGVAVIARIGQPARNRHSLQVEIRRPLYMDEATRERTAGFAAVQRHIGEVLVAIRSYLRSRAPAPGP